MALKQKQSASLGKATLENVSESVMDSFTPLTETNKEEEEELEEVARSSSVC